MSPSPSSERRRVIAFATTSASTALAFLSGQLRTFHEAGWDVHLICSNSPDVGAFCQAEGATYHELNMVRRPSPADFLTIIKFTFTILRIRPDVTVFGTPKAGVFGTLAAWLVRVPTRIYLLHGARWDTHSGLLASTVRALDAVSCRCATNVVAVSDSLRQLFVEQRLVRPAKIAVLGPGSANGVDLEHLQPPTTEQRLDARRELGLSDDAIVIGQVGRLTEDKGLLEIDEVWTRLSSRLPNAHLLLAGAPEPESVEGKEALRCLGNNSSISLLGHLDDVGRIYRATDVCILMSRREGLCMVILEAAACSVPTVAFDAVGVRDVVQESLMVRHGDLDALADGVVELIVDADRRATIGQTVHAHAQRFDRREVCAHWLAFVEGLQSC